MPDWQGSTLSPACAQSLSPRLGWLATIGSSRSFHDFRMQRVQAIMTKTSVAQPVAAKNVVGHETNGKFARGGNCLGLANIHDRWIQDWR